MGDIKRIYWWESPNKKKWSSNPTFDSYEAAKDSAIWHCRRMRRRKALLTLPLEPNQTKLVWRSMYKAGWRIRKKKVRKEQEN